LNHLEISSGKKKKPFNVVLAGTPGIGKSTWAQAAPNPIFLGAEENDELDNASRYPIPGSWDEFVSQLTHLRQNPKDYKTVVIDTADSVEKLLHKKILAMDKNGARAMMQAMGGYGKAYEFAESEMSVVRDILKALRDQCGMHVIILAHTKKVRATDTIIGMEYDTYELNLHAKVQALFMDWVSAVLFANYVAHEKDGVNTDKVFAMGVGQRVLFTEKRPGHLGKNRYRLPYEMELEFADFYAAYEAFYAAPADPDVLRTTILGMIENVRDAKTVDAIIKSVDDNKGNGPMLEKILARVQELTGS
jgi:hypothetical protein